MRVSEWEANMSYENWKAEALVKQFGISYDTAYDYLELAKWDIGMAMQYLCADRASECKLQQGEATKC